MGKKKPFTRGSEKGFRILYCILATLQHIARHSLPTRYPSRIIMFSKLMFSSCFIVFFPFRLLIKNGAKVDIFLIQQKKNVSFFNEKLTFYKILITVQANVSLSYLSTERTWPRWLCSTLFDFIGVFFLLHLHLYHTTIGIEGDEGFAFRKGDREFLATLLGREFPDGGVTLNDESKRLDEE